MLVVVVTELGELPGSALREAAVALQVMRADAALHCFVLREAHAVVRVETEMLRPVD